MQPQRGTTTEHLADIIEILRLGNKSGTLMIERGEDKTLEEGSIIFTDGQAVDARVNQQSGAAAFNYLSTWQKCSFSFISHAVAKNLSPPTIKTLPNTTGSSTTRPLPNITGSSTPRPLPNTTGGLTHGKVTPPPDNAWTKQTTGQQSGFHERSHTARPSLPLRLPRGEEAVQYPENIPLPRIHRRLLLLIDGRRNVSELARLITRDVSEVHKLLNDLERAGLIQK